MRRALVQRWLALPDDDQVHAYGLALCAALFLFHFGLHSWWFVEDAAISFAFARNAAIGEGFVAYPGGEPVEGFSNPTWTLLLAFLRLLGISPFPAAKLLGAAFGVATLPLVWAWTRRMAGGEEAGRWPLLAPLLLALSPQFTLWCASGLENPLFTFLGALGALWLLEEVEDGGAPRSAIPWFLLAVTRPEAPLYTAVAGATGLAFALRRGPRAAWAWAWRWGLAVAGPFVAWHAVRMAYFAWPWPNTYYAKLAAEDRFRPLAWNTAGWGYLRRWALETGQGFLLPVYVLGVTGAGGRRLWFGLTAVVVLWLTWLPGLGWPGELVGALKLTEPGWMISTRVGVLALAALLLPGIGLERPGDAARTLGWTLGVTGVFFALYSGGDWMSGFRWLNPVVVPLTALFVDGVRQIVAALDPWPRVARTLRAVLVAVPVVIGVAHGGLRVAVPEIGPYDVRRRVVYMEAVADRLGLDRPVQLEVDMGAQLWWAPFEHVDLAGLVDVPIGHHAWEQAFLQQYVFQERRPDFAHVHGHWERKSKMPRHPEWKDYVELPGVPMSPRTLHPGNFVRKDLFVQDVWTGSTARRTTFHGGPTLAGLELAIEQVAAGQVLHVALGWRRVGPNPAFRAWLFLARDGAIHVWELPPGYDWTNPTRWKAGEVVVGHHALPLPDALDEGSWDLGLVVVGEGGRAGVLPARDLPDDATNGDPRLARGEVRWPGAVRVVALEVAREAARADLQAAIDAAVARDCGAAEAIWRTARWRLGPAEGWEGVARRALARPLARCWAAWADALSPAEAVPLLVAGRRWDHRDVRLRASARRVADARVAAGDAAWSAGDSDGAYRAWTEALRVDPSRAWVRRRAETARDALLGLSEAR